MKFQNAVAAVLLLSSAEAVKDYLFKDCNNSGFCSRNRHYAKQIKARGNDYIPHYFIGSDSLEIQDKSGFSLKSTITKKLPSGDTVDLPLQISLVEGNNVRITIDENRQHENLEGNGDYLTLRRYNETPNWAFAEKQLSLEQNYEISEHSTDKVKVVYGSAKQYSVEVQFYPIKITVKHKGDTQVIVNEHNLLNVEHLRKEAVNSKHLHPEESDFDMFVDSFPDSKSDRKPFGPESVGIDFTLKGFSQLFGIPEHADTFNLKDTSELDMPYRLYNVDIFEYETSSRMPMYGSIPFLLAAKPDVSVGIFWLNSADTYVDIKKSPEHSTTHWMSENGLLDFMIMIGDTPDEVNKNYGIVTGYTTLPAQFSLGYHQCRWNYNDKQDVLEINRLMDEHQIPYDTIWLDIEYAESKKYFTWSEENFPDPSEMLKELDRTGRNLVIIVDPHLKKGYNISDSLIERKITINDPNNQTYSGHCWPGESVWIDTMNPNSQEYWDYLFKSGEDNYFMGGKSSNIHLWNDMNEPSVFDGPETSSPRDNLHYGGWEHRSIHNVYGLSYHEATFNSLMKRQADTKRQRPFVLTRSYFSGSQRTAAMWTGDNMSKWEYLKASIPMILTSNVVGMPFAGADVGGFFGNPSKELLTRWYQAGIWYPFFRAHAHIDSRRREPWVPGEPYTTIIRDALRLRYALLSVLYTCFREASVSGKPVIRPVFYDNLENLEAYKIEDEFYLGSSGLLIKPVTEEDAKEVQIYIPNTNLFYEYINGEFNGKTVKLPEAGFHSVAVTLDDIPILVEGGHIIARKNRYRRSSKLMAHDPYTLEVALDANSQARGYLYIDDGESHGYADGEYLEVEFEFVGSELISKVSCPNSAYLESVNIEIEKIVIVGELASRLHIASIDSGDETVKIALHPDSHSVTIRKPGLKVNQPWTIQVSVEDKALEHDEL